MAINFVASTYYGTILLTLEELVETNSLQEMFEEDLDTKSYFLLPSFWLISPLNEKDEILFIWNNSGIFSSYEQIILIPPPNF